MSLVEAGIVNLESGMEREIQNAPFESDSVPPLNFKHDDGEPSVNDTSNGLIGATKSWSERLQECVTDDGLVEGELATFVSLIVEATTTQQDDQLLAPLLTADTDSLQALVLQHAIMDHFEQWLQRTQTNNRVLVLVLKVIDRFFKRVPEVFYHLNTPLVEHLKELKNLDNPSIAASAHHAITALRYFLAENSDPALNNLRDAVHEKVRRILVDDADDQATFAPDAKRASPLDSTSYNTPYPGNAPFPADESSLNSSTEIPPLSKNGKPKKKVRWVIDDDYEVKEFFKDHPVRLRAGQAPPLINSNGIPWTLYRLNFGANPPLLVQSTEKIQSQEPTRAYTIEVERQKLESIALYFNDSDIPHNPIDPPYLQDRSTFASHSVTPTHVPFTSKTPVLSHVQLAHIPAMPESHHEPSHEQYFPPQMKAPGQEHQQAGYHQPANYGHAPFMPPTSFDHYAPPQQQHMHGGAAGPNHGYNQHPPTQNYPPPSYPQQHHYPPANHNAPYNSQPMPQPSYDSYNHGQGYANSQPAPYPAHAHNHAPPPHSHAHHAPSNSYGGHPSHFEHKKTRGDFIDMNEVHPTAFIFGRLKSREDRGRFVCRQWRASGGSCEYGAQCKFLHPKDLSKF